MKCTSRWIACLGIGMLLIATRASATPPFGPPEWTQYRMDSTHNAVYENGAGALPSRHFKTYAPVRATPVVIGDHLYVGTHLTGGLFAFDVKTGDMLWGDNTPWFRHAPNWVHSDMICADGRLFLGYGNREFKDADVRGTGASGVMAVDPASGRTLWNHPTIGEVMPTPAFWHGTLYAATGAGRLLALDPATGATRWSLRLPGWVSMSSPAIRNGILYVGAEDAVVAVDLSTHKALWVYQDTATFTDVPPAVSAAGIVVMTGRKQRADLSPQETREYRRVKGTLQFIYAFDGRSGKLLWKHLMGGGPPQLDNTSGAPAIADGVVYVGSPYTRSLFAYDVRSGEKLWEDPIGARIKGAPAIAYGYVFFGDTRGFLHVVTTHGDPVLLPNGDPVEKHKLGGSLSDAKAVALAPAGPVVINQNVFVSSQDGFVYSVSIPAWLGRAPTQPARHSSTDDSGQRNR